TRWPRDWSSDVCSSDLQRFILTVNRAGMGSGSVSSSPPGISCGTDCSEPYGADTVVTLTATPSPLSIFTGWSGCDTVSGATCTRSEEHTSELQSRGHVV